jgi:polyketide synthase PksL/surfactin family lipopeptide synthetase A
MRANVLNFTLIRDGISEVVGESAIPAIESTEFLGAFDTAMRGDLGFSLVARFDPDQVRFLLPVIKIRFSDEMLQLLGISPVRMPDQAEAVARADVDVVMREAWNEVLGYPNPLPDHNFFDWGGTSLSILKLVRIVRERTAVPFDVTDVYESPTIGGMSLLIGQRQKGKHGFSVATAVAGKNDEEGLAKLLKEISTSPRLEIDDALAKYRALDR